MRSLALGTIVKRIEDNVIGFIDTACFQGDVPCYSYTGLEKYGTRGYGMAWSTLEDFEVMRYPTEEDWADIVREREYLDEHPNGEEDEEE